jgi:hypothetical protein
VSDPYGPYPTYRPYGGYPGYPGGADPGARRGYSGFAIASFVTGLVLPLVGLFAAVPLGIIALVRISKTRARGRWMAITGIVLSVLWWVGGVALDVWAYNSSAQRNDAGQISSAGDLGFGDVRVGDCITIGGLSGGGSVTNLRGVPCANPHNAQAYWIVGLTARSYPGEQAVAAQAKAACRPRYGPYAGTGRQPYLLYPTASMWNSSGGHRAVCFVIHVDRQPWTGSVVK